MFRILSHAPAEYSYFGRVKRRIHHEKPDHKPKEEEHPHWPKEHKPKEEEHKPKEEEHKLKEEDKSKEEHKPKGGSKENPRNPPT